MSETKWRIKKESFTDKTNTETTPEDVLDDEDDDIIDKIEKVKQQSKGFGKLPALDDIYKPIEGFREGAKSKKGTKHSTGKRKSDKKSKINAMMGSTSIFSGKEFNTARQIRDFVVNYAKYSDIFYDIEVVMLKINDYIVLAHKLEKSNSALWYYQSMNRSRFNLDESVKILTVSEINLALEAEYEVLSFVKKQPYIDMADKHAARYKKAVKAVHADADLIVSAIRGVSNTLICILISYNILYTWIHFEGKEFGNLIEHMNDNMPSFLTFIAKPAFTALSFIETTINAPKLAIAFMDPVKLYLGMFAIVSYTGIVSSISRFASKLMADSLVAILKGKFSKSPMVYILIVFVWGSYFGGKIMENPGFIAGVVPVLLIGLVFFLTVILSSLLLAPYFALAISGYVVYRFVFMIPIATAIFGMFKVFDNIDFISNPNPDTNTNCSFDCIKHYVQTLQFYFKNLFTIVFSLLTMKTILLFAVKLNNKNLQIALPTLVSVLLLIGIKRKYDSRCNPPVQAPMPAPEPEPEPEPEPVPVPKPEPAPAPEPATVPVPEPEPAPAPKPEPAPTLDLDD